MKLPKSLVGIALGASLLVGCPQQKTDAPRFEYTRQENGMMIPKYAVTKWDVEEKLDEATLRLAYLDRNNDKKADLAVMEGLTKEGVVGIRAVVEDHNGDGYADLLYIDESSTDSNYDMVMSAQLVIKTSNPKDAKLKLEDFSKLVFNNL